MLSLGKMPSMESFSARLATFDESWPNHTRAQPEDFACAGLYYIHKHDSVKCYFCGGGLKNWKLFDDPYYLHAKWFPSCQFIVHKKGLAYVRKVGTPQQNVVFNNCNFGGTLIRSTVHHTTVSQAKVKPTASCSTTFRFGHPTMVNTCTLSKGNIHQPQAAEIKKQQDELKICKICYDDNSNMLFLPCAHLCCCIICSETLTQCPICRRNIQEKVKTYMS